MKELGSRNFHPSFAVASEGHGGTDRAVDAEAKHLVDSWQPLR